jgi:hypothetical protein
VIARFQLKEFEPEIEGTLGHTIILADVVPTVIFNILYFDVK